MTTILHKQESYQILGAAFEVYNQMGSGFLEAVYQECLEIEFRERNLPFLSQKPLELNYKSKPLEAKYIPDFICYEKIIVEIKAVTELNSNHRAQVLNYLKATGYQLGLLINFGKHGGLESERILWN
ncbi:MAG: GxxExxY protein [Lacipirellulaceae bacterium]